MPLFAVIRTQSGSWQPSRPLEQQAEWDAHAAFMDSLANTGFVVLGGPLEGTPNVLLIVRAATAEEVARQFEADPWTANGLLRLTQVMPWILRLGTLG